MVGKMMRWRPWPPIHTRKFQAKLVIHSLRGPKVGTLGGKAGPLAAEVRWKGRPRTPLGSLRRSVRRNCTRGVEVEVEVEAEAEEVFVEWNEEFYCVCDLMGPKDGAFHPWDVALTVFNGFDDGSGNRISIVGIASLNLGEYALAAQEREIEICIPLLSGGTIHEPALSLNLVLSFVELRTSQQSSELMPKTITLVQLSLTTEGATCNDKDGLSNTKPNLRKVKTFKKPIPGGKSAKLVHDSEHNERRSPMRSNEAENQYPFDTDSLDDGLDDGESEDEKEQCGVAIYSYGTLAAANHVGGSFYSEMIKNGQYDDWVYYSHRKCKSDCTHIEQVSATDLPMSPQTFMRSFLPWKKRRMSFKSPKCKGEPLLKGYGEEGGDDIDFDRRIMSSSNESLKNLGDATEGNSSVSKFGDDDFAVGKWERREILSRDGQLKLCTEIFFASIDQRSEQAAGESACTALVAVIADWIQTNPDIMPTQSEFNNLIREGSLEWRNLCGNEIYREQFPDKHFDLETVLQAKVRPLSIVPDRSFVGFFHPEGAANDNSRFEFLRGALSFENIWDELSQVGVDSSTNGSASLYIVSWNDHFFILKVEPEAYYIIDTLGERLFEGCRQAYVLRFDKDTEIRKVVKDGNDAGAKEKSCSTETSKQKQQEQQNATEDPGAQPDDRDEQEEECLCRGKESCKEYIKSFLATIPIQELLVDLKKGLMASTPLHQVLQVDFHYTELSKQIVSGCTQPKASEFVMDSTLVESPAA